MRIADMLSISLCLLLSTLSSSAQTATAQGLDGALAAQTPVTVVVPAGAEPPKDAAPQPGRKFEFRGEGTAVPARFDDDGVPLPVPPVVEASPTGDRVVAPASGNPFTLGFVAGSYAPPEDETVDPALLASLPAQWTDGRPNAETYAFVLFSKRMTPERLAQLEALGCRTLGFHPHYAHKVALPAAAIEQVAALDFVRWVGAPRPWQKVHPRLLEEFERTADGELIDVYIDVYDSDLGLESSYTNAGVAHEAAPDTGVTEGRFDPSIGQVWMSNGWQQRALQAYGVEVREYVDAIRAFRCRIAPTSIEQLVALDFVQFVEADLPDELAHDESMPMVLADYSRIGYDGSWSGEALAGVIDSGLQIFHEALIPHIYIGWDVSPEGWAYLDNCAHGSHVAGTVFGAPPAASASHRGAAKGLGFHASRRIRILKFFDGACVSAGVSHATLYSYMHTNYSDGTNVTPPAQAVNCSWGSQGSTSSPFTGTEAASRTLDAEIFNYGQLYVFASGNEGPAASTLRSPAVAKNAFTVGSIDDFASAGDPGSLSDFSSRGPCGDGRWKPNVVAPGSSIRSVSASGGNSAYTNKSGTSMAAPHVTGFAAMLCDSDTYLINRPALQASLMMATALTKDDVVLTSPSDAHLDQFGAGMINTQTPMYGAANVYAWGHHFSQNTSWNYGDFGIYSGCKRLVVCMTYHEAASSSGASQALVNNFDLFLDSDYNGISASGNTGDYFAQQSTIDNTEIRILDNPFVGSWRWKTWPTSVSSTAYVSVSITAIYASTKPSGTLTLSASDSFVRPFDALDISASAWTPEYFAKNVFVDSTSTAGFLSSSTSLFDGPTTSLMNNAALGKDVTLGLIGPGASRSVNWRVYWSSEGVKPFQVDARSENWIDRTATINVTVDGTPPSAPGAFTSPSHPIGVPVCSGNPAFAWTAATDALSGVDDYLFLIDTASNTTPNFGHPGSVVLDGASTGYVASLAASATAYYAHLRAIDSSGNYGPTVHYGPFRVQPLDVSTYCTAMVNSQFCVPSMSSSGTPQINGGNLTAHCANVLNNKQGLLFWGRAPQASPFQGGTLCVQAPQHRTSSQSSGGTPTGNNCTGNYAFTFTPSYINSFGLQPGDDVYCQWWMRDPQSPSTTGLSDALRFVLCQ